MIDRAIGYYWVTLDAREEMIPAAWVGGNWYIPGQHQPVNDLCEVYEVAQIEPPVAVTRAVRSRG